MTHYSNLGGNSNIVAYELGTDYIKIQFASGNYTTYTYTNISAGSSAIQQMHQLAQAGQGLNSFISRNKPQYASKQ